MSVPVRETDKERERDRAKKQACHEDRKRSSCLQWEVRASFARGEVQRKTDEIFMIRSRNVSEIGKDMVGMTHKFWKPYKLRCEPAIRTRTGSL